ncbi:MAG: type VI secretion system baseplate subunit TssK [Gemmatimonadales bacterium]|nr:MAG: type VI secretion system baseplate subunit TssK [Gemmatimonadales bacterium]
MSQFHGVLWTRGTLLSPQHLQVQDHHLRDLLHVRTSALSSRPWGFTELEIDREALASGSFVLRRAAGLLPDGLAFSVPEADAPPRPLVLDEVVAAGDQGRRILVHLAVPRLREGGRNVAHGDAASDTRWVSDVVLRRDENTGEQEKPVQVARTNLRLQVGGAETPAGALPVARLLRNEAGDWALDPSLVPPLLCIRASDRIRGTLRGLVELMSARANELSATRRQRGGDLADFGVQDTGSFWLLYTLNTHLPILTHLLESPRTHPGEVHRALLELGGALTTFSDRVSPGDLPTYTHGDPGRSFDRLDAVLRDLLATVIPRRHVSIPMREVSSSVVAASLDDDRHLEADGVYLAVRSDADAETLERRFPGLAKVGSGDRIERLIRQALPGLALRPLSTPPSAIPVKLDRTYFQVETQGEDWEAVRRARNLAAYIPSDFPSTDVEVVLLLPDAG